MMENGSLLQHKEELLDNTDVEDEGVVGKYDH